MSGNNTVEMIFSGISPSVPKGNTVVFSWYVGSQRTEICFTDIEYFEQMKHRYKMHSSSLVLFNCEGEGLGKNKCTDRNYSD